MRKAFYNILIIFILSFTISPLLGASNITPSEKGKTEELAQHQNQPTDSEIVYPEAEEEAHHAPPGWTVIPFVLLLLMIATGPLFYEHFWHKNYPKVALALAAMVVLYYLFVLHNTHGPVHALAEYVQFIALLASLYIASGGIMIDVDKKATPVANVILLVVGAVISNLVGTTGASMLLIRPFIRLNKT